MRVASRFLSDCVTGTRALSGHILKGVCGTGWDGELGLCDKAGFRSRTGLVVISHLLWGSGTRCWVWVGGADDWSTCDGSELRGSCRWTEDDFARGRVLKDVDGRGMDEDILRGRASDILWRVGRFVYRESFKSLALLSRSTEEGTEDDKCIGFKPTNPDPAG